MMSELTDIELKALEAIDNEAMTCTRAEREAFKHQANAYRNAAIYADLWGFDVDAFRQTITKLTGVTAADIKTKRGRK